MKANHDYFSHVRQDIEPLLPSFADRVLEVGCGAGTTLAWLKRTGRCGTTVGVECVPAAAEAARAVVDEVYCCNAETMDFGTQRFDLVLLLDILEHLLDPWGFLERLREKHLQPGALVIASIPNIRNYRVLKALVLRGEFTYQDAGILDRTHLRFFTRSSAAELMQTGGMRIETVHDITMSKKSYRRLDRITAGMFHDFFVYQFLISARHGGQHDTITKPLSGR